MMVCLVIPGKHASANGVKTLLFLIIKIFVAFVSATKPYKSSIIASSTPA